MKPTWTYGMQFALFSAVVLGSAVYTDASTQHSGAQREKDESPSERSAGWHKITGTVKQAKPVGLRHKDQENLLVQLETDKGRRRVVDVGEAKRLEVDLKSGDKLTAWGQTMNFGGKEVFIARKLEAHGKKFSIEHSDLSLEDSDRRETELKTGDKRSEPYSGQGQIEGEVVAVGQVTEYERAGNVLAFDRDHFYIVQEADGRQTHLIVADDMDPGFAVGELIQARVRPDGTVTSVARASDLSRRNEEQRARSREETAQYRETEQGS